MIYTIGHSNHTVVSFLFLLKQYGIKTVWDIRSVPYSTYVPQFNREYIMEELKQIEVAYQFMGDYFGGRSEDRSLYAKEGYLDYDKVMKSSQFLQGIFQLETFIKSGENLALMCTEHDPIDCHRAILVTKYLHSKNTNICHIRKNGEVETQDQLEERLLRLYQLIDSSVDQATKIDLAYKRRNKSIAFQIRKTKHVDYIF